MRLQRVVLLTLDGVGVGALPDADRYGDAGANTLLHVAEACGGLRLPVLGRMGLGNILSLPGVPPVVAPQAAWGRMAERSTGKDSTTGHWEIAGIIEPNPLPTYPRGFPEEIVAAFRRETGLVPLGNMAASGTDILRLLGDEHVRSGRPIIYTSADSVFQIAAHEEVIPVARLYEICAIARKLLDPYRIGRVIARPFVGDCAENYCRTSRRHDFSLSPTAPTILDAMVAAGLSVYGVGKIQDLFAGRGVDRRLPELLAGLRTGDLLIITADHGCDPTTAGTDHSREYVPLLAWSPGMSGGTDLGRRQSFAHVAATLAEGFGLGFDRQGSFLADLRFSVAKDHGG
ncbi:MAG: phosphopentomutase [Desulfuromonadaceae bacterium]